MRSPVFLKADVHLGSGAVIASDVRYRSIAAVPDDGRE
jgi:hypothetical protein